MGVSSKRRLQHLHQQQSAKQCSVHLMRVLSPQSGQQQVTLSAKQNNNVEYKM